MTKETALCKEVRSSMLEQILDRRNIEKALEQVTRNKGAGGIDGMQTDELRDYLDVNWYFTRQRCVGFTNYYFWKTGHQIKLF